MDWIIFPIILALVGVNAFFVAAEFALVGVRKTRIKELVSAGNKRARLVDHQLNNIDTYLTSSQLGITFASIALGWLGEPFFDALVHPVIDYLGLPSNVTKYVSILIAYLFVTFLHMVLGEIAPKSAAIRVSEPIALWCAYPLHVFTKLTKHVLLNPCVWCAKLLLKPFGISIASGEVEHRSHSEDEIKMIIEGSSRSGVLEEGEEKLLYKVLKFTDTTAREIMTPRFDIVAVKLDSSVSDIAKLARESGHSRFPVIGERLDDVKGAIHIKDVIAYLEDPDSFEVSTIKRSVNIVPEGKHVDDILKELQESRNHLAIVVDEYGTVEGLLTIEDMVEALVGPIADEFDVTETPNIRAYVEGESYLVHGLTSLDEFNASFRTNLEAEDSVTVAGYIMERLEKVPSIGEIIIGNVVSIEVREMEGNRISEAFVQILSRTKDDDEDKE